MSSPTVLELFCGAGGLALGLEMAGFNAVATIDNDKHSSNTLKINRPDWNVVCNDIAIVDPSDVYNGEIDVLSGGPPCQSFSYAGKKMGFEDVRGTMFYEYARFLQHFKPKMFIFENVKGLATHDKGRTINTILSIFEDIGYRVVWKVLNAWDYNVPQKRERAILIGTRYDLDIDFNYPPHYKIGQYWVMLLKMCQTVYARSTQMLRNAYLAISHKVDIGDMPHLRSFKIMLKRLFLMAGVMVF